MVAYLCWSFRSKAVFLWTFPFMAHLPQDYWAPSPYLWLQVWYGFPLFLWWVWNQGFSNFDERGTSPRDSVHTSVDNVWTSWTIESRLCHTWSCIGLSEVMTFLDTFFVNLIELFLLYYCKAVTLPTERFEHTSLHHFVCKKCKCGMESNGWRRASASLQCWYWRLT